MSDERQVRHDFNGRLQTLFQDFFFNWVFSSAMSDEEIMDRYFTPDFSAHIDGVDLDKDQFQSRVGRMRREAIVEHQEFIEMMEEGDRLFSMHSVKGQSLASGQPFETRAIAFFVFKGDKIETAYLNSATKGAPEDADIASRS